MQRAKLLISTIVLFSFVLILNSCAKKNVVMEESAIGATKSESVLKKDTDESGLETKEMRSAKSKGGAEVLDVVSAELPSGKILEEKIELSIGGAREGEVVAFEEFDSASSVSAPAVKE